MAVQCARCDAENPDHQRFCGACGSPLDVASEPIERLNADQLQERVHQIIRDHYKDQKVVELETTQAIATRISDWTKLFGFFVGIPVAVMFLLLGALGIKTYSDFASKVEVAQSEIGTNLDKALKQSTSLKLEGETLSREYEELRSKLADTKELAARVETLTNKVDVISETVALGFTSSSKITPETKKQLESAFNKFQEYLYSLGYPRQSGNVEIDIPQKALGALAYYDTDKHRLVINSKYASDPDLLYHQFMHHVLLSVSGSVGDPALRLWAYYAIETGLASYFPCSFNNNPRLAEKTALISGGEYQVWDLNKVRSFNDLRPTISITSDATSTLIWGGAFWELRRRLGQATTDKLLFDAWFKLRPSEVLADKGVAFVKKLLDTDKSLAGGASASKIQAVFAERGLRF